MVTSIKCSHIICVYIHISRTILYFVPLLHHECIGAHLIQENTGKEVHGPELDPLGLFVPILRYLGQTSYTAPSFLPSPPLSRKTVDLLSPAYFEPTASSSMLSLASGSVPCFSPWMSVQLYVFEVFLLHRHRRQLSRAALKLSYPVASTLTKAFSNKLGFSS